MLRALQQLGRARGIEVAASSARHALEAPHCALALPTLSQRRPFAASAQPSADGSSDSASDGSGAAGSAGTAAGGQRAASTKQWRSWIDDKLDGEARAGSEQQEQGSVSAAAAAAQEPAAAAAPAAESAAAADAAAAAPEEQEWRGAQRQQIYSVEMVAHPAVHSALPPGVGSYGQLAMASDAPRFPRSAGNIGEQSPLRLHPTRLFFPHSTYSPQDLDPYKAREQEAAAGVPLLGTEQAAMPKLASGEVARLADYKNAPLLASFLSEMGKLPARGGTQLRAKHHRHLARQVKVARCMAILSPTSRWQPYREPPQEPLSIVVGGAAGQPAGSAAQQAGGRKGVQGGGSRARQQQRRGR